ncbi:MAG: hypothetical protein GXP18_00265 [Gammaproteobacteria bacterium]|nr:hypothetical protein [Gammaproteobacteria bacterium]
MYFRPLFEKISIPLMAGALGILLTSCKGEPIEISQNNLDKSSVTLTQNGIVISKDDFLRFSFTTPKPLIDIAPVESLFQVRATINKGGKIIFKDIASGAFLTADAEPHHANSYVSYSAYFFKSLVVNSNNETKPVSITGLDYDTLSLVVIYPEMGTGIKHSSNRITYSKDLVSEVISRNPTKVTLIVP